MSEWTRGIFKKIPDLITAGSDRSFLEFYSPKYTCQPGDFREIFPDWAHFLIWLGSKIADDSQSTITILLLPTTRIAAGLISWGYLLATKPGAYEEIVFKDLSGFVGKTVVFRSNNINLVGLVGKDADGLFLKPVKAQHGHLPKGCKNVIWRDTGQTISIQPIIDQKTEFCLKSFAKEALADNDSTWITTHSPVVRILSDSIKSTFFDLEGTQIAFTKHGKIDADNSPKLSLLIGARKDLGEQTKKPWKTLVSSTIENEEEDICERLLIYDGRSACLGFTPHLDKSQHAVLLLDHCDWARPEIRSLVDNLLAERELPDPEPRFGMNLPRGFDCIHFFVNS